MMPITYIGTIKEAKNVRDRCGVFDISHMSRIIIEGNDSEKYLNKLIAKDITHTVENRMFGPTAFLNSSGGFIDDIMLYKLSEEKYMIVGNAVNRFKDINWLKSHIKNEDVKIIDSTENLAMLAIQGPETFNIIEKYCEIDLNSLKMLEYRKYVKIFNIEVFLISRSGWTGEKGIEIICSKEKVVKLWRKILNIGIKPAGLACRDILRIEMGFCLYGNDIDEKTTPLEARYWVFDLEKENYIGREKLLEQYINGVEKVRIGIRMKKRTPIPRPNSTIIVDGKVIGRITSGTFSPTLARNIGIGYVDSRHSIIGLPIQVNIRGKMFGGKIVEFPFITPRW
ncbi:MAG TPA: glycine cleavage system aminomethyltransferase GcvT [Thermoprotei archaeon]|nr:glycine cleavage system aminomethyltransferase GcvT [Thermoprotei archaeon]